MTTMLHLLAVAGVTILVVLVVVIPAAFIVLGLLDRRDIKREAAKPSQPPPIRPSQFEPYVPPHQPHTDWSEIKGRREQDTPPDNPAS
jgi:hypothetical protein